MFYNPNELCTVSVCETEKQTVDLFQEYCFLLTTDMGQHIERQRGSTVVFLHFCFYSLLATRCK